MSFPEIDRTGHGGRLLTTSEAAGVLGVSARTLEDWRLRGGGPVFCKLGMRLVRYALEDLRAFIDLGARSNTGQVEPGASMSSYA